MPIDPQIQEILNQYDRFGAPPLTKLSPENARNNPTLKNAVEELVAHKVTNRLLTLAKPMPEPVAQIKHILIPGPNGDLLARVYLPGGTGPLPVLVYFHGGGWVIANLDVYEPSCRALCNAAECIVVSVAYRQAPEYKFPAAMEDAYAAVQWVLQNAAHLSGDPTRVAVGGESAGGNLATVTCLRARDEGHPLPIFQLLIYPVTNYAFNTPSYYDNKDGKPLSADMMPWFWNHYLRSDADGQFPYASPLRALSLSGMPPALVITAEYDVLRDEGELYAEKLSSFGVPVTLTRYDGMVHEFFGLAGIVNKAKDAVDQAAGELKRVFTGSGTGFTRVAP